jgi:hypothetical protein
MCARRRGPESPRRFRRGSCPCACPAAPSKRKLKPRSGLSICGELTPRSSSTPSTCAMPSAASAARISAKRRGGSRSAGRRCRLAGVVRGHRLRVAIEGHQPAAPAQPLQQRARVPAAAEGAVHVDTVPRTRPSCAARAESERASRCRSRRRWRCPRTGGAGPRSPATTHAACPRTAPTPAAETAAGNGRGTWQRPACRPPWSSARP